MGNNSWYWKEIDAALRREEETDYEEYYECCLCKNVFPGTPYMTITSEKALEVLRKMQMDMYMNHPQGGCSRDSFYDPFLEEESSTNVPEDLKLTLAPPVCAPPPLSLELRLGNIEQPKTEEVLMNPSMAESENSTDGYEVYDDNGLDLTLRL